MKWLTTTSEIIGILGALFSLVAAINTCFLRKKLNREKQRQNQLIRVILNHGSQSIELPVKMRREELTRSEVLGFLGMIPMKGGGQPRFLLKYLNKPEFFRQIRDIKDGIGELILTIPCSEEEYNQFDI